jgi:hypothetical protein
MIRTHSVRVLWARGSRRIVSGIWAALFFGMSPLIFRTLRRKRYNL